MQLRTAFLVAAAANAAQGRNWPVWNKRQDYGYVTSTPEISPYVTAVETICTSTDTITLPPETGTYDCPTTITTTEECTATITAPAETITNRCPYETSSTNDCPYQPGGECVVHYTATSDCVSVIPGTSSESTYDCVGETSSNAPCEKITTPTSISTSTYQCTTTITSSTTIYKKITITDTRTLTIPSPTTTTSTLLVPTLITTTVTRDGTTETLTITSTSTREIAVPTTVTSVSKTTDFFPVTTTILSTITRDGTTEVLTITTTARETDIIPGLPTTILSTITRDGTTEVLTLTTTARETVLITQPGITVILPPSTVTLEASTVTLPASSFISTITLSGTTTTTTITQPASTIVQPPSTVTLPASTVISTTTMTSALSTPLPPSPVSPPAAPAPPACYISGPTPTADASPCNGRTCAITFDEGAYVHWEVLPDSPPLVTEVRFENPAARQTCITTSCNTELFSRSYYTSLASCAFPPCPSNSVDQNCNIVVGPIKLPDGQTTSVTQIGDSGWNINLGPTATARDIGRCGPLSSDCITSAQPTLSTDLVYTGSVTSTSVFNTVLGSSVIDYLLSQLPDYFPPGDILGDCTTATLATPTPDYRILRARQVQQVLTAGGSKVITWKQQPSLTGLEVNMFQPDSTRTVDSTTTITALPDVLPSRTAAEPPASQTATPPAISSNPPTSESTSPTSAENPPASLPQSPSSATSQNPVPTESTIIVSSPIPTTSTQVGTQSDTATASAPAGTASPSPGSIVSPVSTATNSPTGLAGIGTVTITETVYYSMLAPPDQRSAVSELESLRSGISTATGDLGDYVCGILGCTWMGSTTTATGSVVTDSVMTSNEASSTASGAAVRGREVRVWFGYAPILPVVAGVFG